MNRVLLTGTLKFILYLFNLSRLVLLSYRLISQTPQLICSKISNEKKIMLLHFNTYLSNSLRSEHERHSPNCPFVKGEHTQNVPLSVTLATSPAQFPCTDGTDRIVCFGSGSCPHFLAAATKRGKICIWDISKLMKVSCCLEL